jgi:hypothetical protein
MVLKGLSSATDAIPSVNLEAARLRQDDEDIPEEDLVEEFEFIGDNHNEEYMRVQNINNHSYSIIPYSNV